MSDVVNLTIDGVAVTVAKGTNLLEAAKTIRGCLISDIVPIFGMINMIGGECDK